MKSKLGECPLCGSKKIVHQVGLLKVSVSKGRFINIPDIEFEKCNNCGETITDYKTEKKIDELLKIRRKVA